MPANPPRWTRKPDGSVWISHHLLGPADADRLRDVSHLTMWNVRLPAGFLSGLPRLEWFDLRGGTSADLGLLAGCAGLRGLVVNQLRGLRDASAIESLTGLEVLSLYGLTQLQALPDLSRLPRLRRLDLGQMRSLADWSILPRLPAMEHLVFANKLGPDLAVMGQLAGHPRLRVFDWWAPDEPAALVQAVLDAVGRPRPAATRPEQYFAENC